MSDNLLLEIKKSPIGRFLINKSKEYEVMKEKTRNEWSWQEYIEDLYKKVLPKVYSRLAKAEGRLEDAENRISVVEGLFATAVGDVSDCPENCDCIGSTSPDNPEVSEEV